MKGDYPIPFNAKGDQLHYDDGRAKMRDNFEFVDTLKMEGMSRGRSAAYFLFRRKSTGTQVIVFMTDLIDLFAHANHGCVTGLFTFCKRGQNYGCRMVEAE